MMTYCLTLTRLLPDRRGRCWCHFTAYLFARPLDTPRQCSATWMMGAGREVEDGQDLDSADQRRIAAFTAFVQVGIGVLRAVR
ncbi:hypothetical protein Sme01_35350 [Sphaerisporangium melleum]|uniref:Uncharacterized protein n=1 Tax=Sphaerisporangium melleum TaxID=321316 RepID=A0A917RA53_9ACTN|nr:hypothetical protein GCM10007964_44010 [Sphaerisporangium melleum]GII71059.1 hypothetical protein Sme01_35350 [Sphaerisporangium melleum]